MEEVYSISAYKNQKKVGELAFVICPEWKESSVDFLKVKEEQPLKEIVPALLNPMVAMLRLKEFSSMFYFSYPEDKTKIVQKTLIDLGYRFAPAEEGLEEFTKMILANGGCPP